MGLTFAGIKFRVLPHPRNLEIARGFNFADGLLSDFSRGFNFADGELDFFLIILFLLRWAQIPHLAPPPPAPRYT